MLSSKVGLALEKEKFKKIVTTKKTLKHKCALFMRCCDSFPHRFALKERSIKCYKFF